MCSTREQVQRPRLGDVTAGMTDAEQAAYWKASRDRMAAQNMEQAAKLEQQRLLLARFVAIRDWNHDTDAGARHDYDNAASDAAAALQRAGA